MGYRCILITLYMETQKPANLYVVLPHLVGVREDKSPVTRGQFISVKKNRFTAMEPFLPSEEALKVHFEAERVRMAIFKRDHPEPDHVYIPQPLYIEIEPNTFDEILEQVRAVEPLFNQVKGMIALTLGGGVPCCILNRHDDSEVMKEVPVETETETDKTK